MQHAVECDGLIGSRALRNTLPLVANGSGSPLESQAFLLLFGGRRKGGEGWPRPHLNRQLRFTPEAQHLAGQSYCIGDMVFTEKKAVIEINGKAYHADKHGFSIESGRRAALESMGYSVLDLTHDQLCDLEKLDAMLPSLAERLGFPLKPRTAAFLKQRAELHAQLFARSASSRRP